MIDKRTIITDNLPFCYHMPEIPHCPAPTGQETPKRGCSYRRVLCARTAGEAEKGLRASGRSSLRPSLAAQSPTRWSVTRFSTADTTSLLRGLVWTRVNMSPPGSMNRSYLYSTSPGKVLRPVQSALTVYVPENFSLRVTSPSELIEKTP